MIEALLAICPSEPLPSDSLSNAQQNGWSIVLEHVGSLISATLRNAIIRPGQLSSVVSPRKNFAAFFAPERPRILTPCDAGTAIAHYIFAVIGRAGYEDTIR